MIGGLVGAWNRSENGAADFILTCTTTGAQTLTLQSLGIVAGQTIVVTWGDGNSDTYSGTASRTHAYAGAGTWIVTFRTPQHIRILDLRDTKLSGTINAANPMPTGITSLYLYSLANLTWTVSATAPMPTGITYLYLQTLAGLTAINDWSGINAIRIVQYENSLSQAQIDAVVASIYTNRASYTYAAPTLDIAGGSNAAPSGTYADEDPPTTGKGYIYELVVDPETEGFNKWAITYTP